MPTRKYTASALSGLALLALGACGSATESVEPVVAPTNSAPTQPPLPLPTTDPTDAIDEAYLDSLADEGIHLPEREALAAAETACEGDGFMGSISSVVAETGLSDSDAAFLVGAALVTCGGA